MRKHTRTHTNIPHHFDMSIRKVTWHKRDIVFRFFMSSFCCDSCCLSSFLHIPALCIHDFDKEMKKKCIIIVSFHRKTDCLLQSFDFRHITFFLQPEPFDYVVVVSLTFDSFIFFPINLLCCCLTFHL